MLSVVYQPKGAAREYATLACNIYMGCTHGCSYCYAPAAIHVTKEEYFSDARPKGDFLGRLYHDAKILSAVKNCPEILLSFIGDPYQPAEADLRLTRGAIKILIEHNLPFTILTKGGLLAKRDFDLLRGYGQFRFGVSINTILDQEAREHEQRAAPVVERILSLYDAMQCGIETWVSLEPVINPDSALELIYLHHEVVGHWMIGKINHNRKLEDSVDWLKFRNDAERELCSHNASYTFKQSIAEASSGI